MSEENNSPNTNTEVENATNTGNTSTSNTNTSSTNTSDTISHNEQTTHHRRRRPRRTGGQGGGRRTGKASTEENPAHNANDAKNETVNKPSAELAVDSSHGQEADEAAMAEGGIKAVGNQKIINFMGIKKPMVIFSGLMVVIALVAIFGKGLNLGLDFTGGVSADVTYEQPVENAQAVVQSLAEQGFDDAVVQYLGTQNELLVRLPPQDNSDGGLSKKLEAALDLKGSGLQANDSQVNTSSINKAKVKSLNIIGSQVGNEVYLNSLLAMALALGCMLLYVAVRFQFKLSMGAVIALFHDAIVTLGVFAIMGWPFDLTVLAAILALIGYSLNDTIVVYDRIRENFRRVRGLDPAQVINLSLTETLRRTIMTSMTVLLVVGAMMFLGGDGLFWFSITLFIGLIAGTYSSVYIASAIPLLMGLNRDDFVVTVKPEFEEEVVSFEDRNAPVNAEMYDDEFIKEV